MSTFEEVLDIFGGSIFPEDYRANLDTIRQRLDSTSPKGEEYTEANAVHDLLSSLYHAHCSDNGNAFSVFQRILDHKDLLSRRWELRCTGYKAFHLTLRRYPPIIRFRSEEKSISYWIHNDLFSPNECGLLSRQATHLKTELKDSLYQTDSLEATILIQYATSNTMLYSAFQLHPAYPLTEMILPDQQQEHAKRLMAVIPGFINFIFEVMQNGFTRLSVNLSIRLAGILYACGQADDFNQLISQTLQLCIDGQDEVGQALCKMAQADMISSPPCSSPIALNLIASDGISYGYANQTWDPCEDALTLVVDPAAVQLYEAASRLFGGCGSHNGCAAVKLRLSGIKLSQLAFRPMQNSAIHRAQFEEIKAYSDTTLPSSDQYGTSVQISKCHQILLNVLRGETDYALELIEAIADWGKSSKNEVVVHFIGCLILRYGRRLWKDQSLVDVALACFSCAERLFLSMGNHVGEFQAINASATVHDTLTDVAMAIEEAQRAREKLDGVLAEIDRHIATAQDSAIAENLSFAKEFMLTFYGFFLKSLSASSDANTLFPPLENEKAASRRSTEKDEPLDTEYQALSDLLVPSAAGKTLEEVGDGANQFFALGKEYKIRVRESTSHFASFDVDAGRKILRDFCHKVEAVNLTQMEKGILCCLASFAGGDREMCLKYLSDLSESDDELYLVTRPVFTLAVPWCRNKYSQGLRSIGEAENLLRFCVMANDWSRGARLIARLEKASPGFFDPAGPDSDIDIWQRDLAAAHIAEYTGDIATALQRYIMAERQLEVRRSRSSGPDAKLANLSTSNVVELFLGLSRVSLRCAEAGIPLTALTEIWKTATPVTSWRSVALMFVERGRARTILEALSKRSDVTESRQQDSNVEIAYRRRLRRYLLSLPIASLDSDTQEDIQTELRYLEATLEKLKALPNAVRPEPTTDDDVIPGNLYTCLDEHTLFVELAFSVHESVFIAATASGIQYAAISRLRRWDIRDPAYRAMKAINEYSRNHSRSSPSRELLEEMERCTSFIVRELEKISHSILDPIAGLIRSHSRVVFSTGSPLVALPFAALPFDGQPLFMSTAVSTTPSLAVYAELSSQSRSFVPKVATITKHKLSKTERPLPLAAIESMLIADQFNTWPRQARKLSGSKFCEMMQDCTIMHIGTHGVMHADSPWLSHISLKKKFRVIDLWNAKGKVALMVFGACQSGLGKAEGDETLGFANAILQTGAMAYLGALWEVDDVATMIVMIYFYRAVRLQPVSSGRTITDLWRSSMEAFYNTDTAMARELVTELIQGLDRCRELGNNPDTILDGATEELSSLLDNGINVNFKHPYFYASFALTGFGGLVCEPPHESQSQAS